MGFFMGVRTAVVGMWLMDRRSRKLQQPTCITTAYLSRRLGIAGSDLVFGILGVLYVIRFFGSDYGAVCRKMWENNHLAP